MFHYLSARWFLAKTQAEFYAQHADQEFVNAICHRSTSLEFIESIRQHAYYRKSKMNAYLAVSSLLGECLSAQDVDVDDKSICAALLEQRIQRTSEQFRIRHFQLFSEMEQRLEDWRRQQRA